MGARGPRAAVGRRGAEQHVAGQGVVQNRTSGTAEGGAPAMAAYALVREGATQRAAWGQVPVKRKLGV